MKTANLNSSCKEAELYYYELLGGEGVGSIPAGVEEHVKGCAWCQVEMGRLKDALSRVGDGTGSGAVGASGGVVGLLKLHLAYVGKRVSCETVRPFLATLCDPALEIRVPTPITVHLQRCVRCSEDVERIRRLNLDGGQLRRLCELFTGGQGDDETARAEELREVVQEIVGRSGPEIVTIYHAEEAGEAEGGGGADGVYEGYPIRVEVVEPKEEVKAEGALSRIDFVGAVRRRLSRVSWRPYVRAAAVIAAVALTAAIMLNAPAAKALTIGEIYNAIAKMENVYVAKFVGDRAEPALERWVSRTSKIYMTKAGSELVLWDIRNGLKKTTGAGRGAMETSVLGSDDVVAMEAKMRGSLGLLPFYDMAEVPAGAEWVRVSESELGLAAAVAEVYDLKWTVELRNGSVVLKKWRFFVEGSTRFPERIEVYAQLPGGEGYTLETVMTVRYLSEGEMEEAVRSNSF